VFGRLPWLAALFCRLRFLRPRLDMTFFLLALSEPGDLGPLMRLGMSVSRCALTVLIAGRATRPLSTVVG